MLDSIELNETTMGIIIAVWMFVGGFIAACFFDILVGDYWMFNWPIRLYKYFSDKHYNKKYQREKARIMRRDRLSQAYRNFLSFKGN